MFLDVADVAIRGVLAEGDSGFIKIDLLARGFLILVKAVLDEVTIILRVLEEDEAIVCSEKMGDHGASSRNPDPWKAFMERVVVKDSRKALGA